MFKCDKNWKGETIDFAWPCGTYFMSRDAANFSMKEIKIWYKKLNSNKKSIIVQMQITMNDGTISSQLMKGQLKSDYLYEEVFFDLTTSKFRSFHACIEQNSLRGMGFTAIDDVEGRDGDQMHVQSHYFSHNKRCLSVDFADTPRSIVGFYGSKKMNSNDLLEFGVITRR